MTDTLFSYLKGGVSNSDDTDPETSAVFYNPPMSAYHNVSRYQRETISLDSAATKTTVFRNYNSVFCVGILARVVGYAKLTTVGVDWDGSSAITGVTGGYGTDRYPGYISMITTNVQTFTWTGLADGTTIEYLAMIIIPDSSL